MSGVEWGAILYTKPGTTGTYLYDDIMCVLHVPHASCEVHVHIYSTMK